MNWVIVLTLIGGCLATPLQQGNLKVYRYNTNRDGIFAQNEGIPVAPQPIIYNPQQPFQIQEPAPLTYSNIRGSALGDRDEQRHINVDEEIEAREEGVPEDQSRPVEDARVDVNDESKEDVRRNDDQKPVQTENAALLGSSVVGVKGRETVQPDSYDLDLSQLYSGQLPGQRRLIEPQPQLYGVKSYNVQPQVVYQAVQHRVPITVDEQKISVQGLQKPVVQYQTANIQKPYIPREWVRQPVQQVQPLTGVKGGQKPIQWYIQPVIPSDISVLSQQSGGQIGSQRIQPVQLQGIQEQAQVQPQVITIPANLQGIRIQQREPVQEDGRVESDSQGKVEQGSQSVGGQQEVQDLRQSHVQQQQQQQRPEVLSQTQGKSPLDQTVNRVVVQTTSQRHVPVVSGQRVLIHQLNGQSLQQQIPVQHQLISPVGQQQIQYSTIPINDLQQYYQLIQNSPLQTVGQQDNRYITYSVQSPSYVQQPIQPIQYSSYQTVGQLEQGMQNQGVQPVQPLSVDNVQRVQVQDLRKGQGQDLRINPLSVDQRQQRSFRGQSGVKGSVNV